MTGTAVRPVVRRGPWFTGVVATPAEYPWSGHAALRAEDRERLDLHPLYLSLGADAESRYRAYLGLVAEDAARARPCRWRGGTSWGVGGSCGGWRSGSGSTCRGAGWSGRNSVPA